MHARVAHHLQDGGVLVAVEAGLVEGLAAVAQRVVHVDQGLAVDRSSPGRCRVTWLEKFFGIWVPG